MKPDWKLRLTYAAFCIVFAALVVWVKFWFTRFAVLGFPVF